MGIVSTFSQPRPDYLLPLTQLDAYGLNFAFLRAIIIVICLVALVSILGLGVVRLRLRPHRPVVRHPATIAMLVWLVSHGLFTLWWNSDNLEFWLMALAPFLILLAQRVATQTEPLYSARQRNLLLALLGVVNLSFRVVPDARSSDSPIYRQTHWFDCAQLADGDWLVGGAAEMEPCLRYLCGRAVQYHSLTYEFYGSGADKAATLHRYATQLQKALREHTVYLHDDELHPQAISGDGHWTSAEAQELYAPYLRGATMLSTSNREGRVVHLFRLSLPPASDVPSSAAAGRP